jgi:hypothetical protein
MLKLDSRQNNIFNFLYIMAAFKPFEIE